MGSKTKIEWTDATWNPITGCTEISPGCANCYAARLAATRLRNVSAYKGLASLVQHGKKPLWKQQVRFNLERLEEPLHWRKPRKIFVCDMSDLFHEKVPQEWIAKIFQVMFRADWHTYQILTKRAGRMREIMQDLTTYSTMFGGKPLPHVWLGVSVENQRFADERIPMLLETPAAVRWISAEPLLGPINLDFIGPVGSSKSAIGCRPCNWKQQTATAQSGGHTCHESRPKLDWIVCGFESGPHARPGHPNWARSLRDQAVAASIPFFFKQWGEWAPAVRANAEGDITWPAPEHDKSVQPFGESGPWMQRWGKKVAGRLLDGREWSEFPK